MNIGSTRPEFKREWKEKHFLLWLLTPCEYFAAWFFYLFNSVAIFRFSIEAIAVIAIIYSVAGVIGEFEQRKIDRGIRVATLYAQIAQLHALPEGKGLWGIRASVAELAREGVPMRDIVLSGANLAATDLVGADLFRANLSNANLVAADLGDASLILADITGANLGSASLERALLTSAHLKDTNLFRANLRGANLTLAKLNGANLRGADLTDANLFSADLSGADLRSVNGFRGIHRTSLAGANLSLANLNGAMLTDANLAAADISRAELGGAIGLSKSQLMIACAESNSPPSLPQSLVWSENPCLGRGEYTVPAPDLPFPDYP